ncbi:uncharacterized protein LOC116778383 [Danaus plexippus]|uniref:uncharacterized protein LOC116778383 n=1 Tax=Danaus plexippus TaxID=13037 RepID=UPI002AB2CEE5|nr:uncharacterized protein LOC116778383 [Danaus plexippus]XP_061381733.1 uncharacterized protein LOC116778383 [Danaus plexippus]
MTSLTKSSAEYQGYPYRNPIATEVQTIDQETETKWTNLPRRNITERIRENTNRSTNSRTVQAIRPNSLNLAQTNQNPSEVYIELPIARPDERNESAGNLEDSSRFVEETILYDPFEDRRINIQRPENLNSQQNNTPESPLFHPEARPGAGGSRSDLSQVVTSSRPPIMSKETFVYGARTPDDFPLSPIPVSEFPEPPPAYTEVYTPQESQPPRTVVIVPDQQTPVGIASNDRKLLSCAHCGLRVHTLAVRENGVVTHMLAILFFFIFAPLTLLIYCTDFCKYRNHYCPNCNQLIGYEVPILCQDMVYNKTG